MKQYIAIFDNYVTDDIIVKRINADTTEQADEIAWEMSKGTGLSEGNYELYIDVMHMDEEAAALR